MFTILHILLGFLSIQFTAGHICAWHPSMWGFNVTDAGNRPQDPLMDRSFSGWWFHNHLSHPPHPTDVLEFPAGGKTTVETTCDKGATSFWPTNPGGKVGDVVNGNDPCPGKPPSEYHTTGKSDVKGCAFAIAYIPPSQVNTIKPEDFTIFSVNQTCVWYRHTDFHVPANMPACPPGGCTCAWFWVHAADSGSEQIYMNGYQCNITGATSTTPIAKPQLARRCGKETEPDRIGTKPQSATNCTYGAKQPLYWDNLQGNNMFEDPHHPPFYNDLYHFLDGAQDDIFMDSHLPSMTWAGAPTGVLKPVNGQFGTGAAKAGSPSTPTPSASPVMATPKPKATIAPPQPYTQSIPDMPKASPLYTPKAAHSDAPKAAQSDAPKATQPDTHPKGCQCHKCKTKNNGKSSQCSNSNSNAHPKGCQCHKCKGGSSTMTANQGTKTTEETKTISPEEASSILSMASKQTLAAEPEPSPSSASSYSYRTRRHSVRRHGVFSKRGQVSRLKK